MLCLPLDHADVPAMLHLVDLKTGQMVFRNDQKVDLRGSALFKCEGCALFVEQVQGAG